MASVSLRNRRQEALEYRLMLAATFLVLALGLAISWPVRVLLSKNSGSRPTVLRAAWQKAAAVVPFVFMT